MDGDVALTSIEGQGVTARVWLRIPVLDSGSARSVDLGVPKLPKMRVLAAEDNATNRIILQSMLQALGVEAVIVADGAEAVQRYQSDTFDAVLFDIAMPNMDGIETLAALKSLAQTAGQTPPPAIAVTANVMTHQVEDYLGYGFTSVVPKPIRMEMLGQALAQCLPAEAAAADDTHLGSPD